MMMPNVPEPPQTADSGAPRREGFNLSAVALRYRQVTLFFLLICGIGGGGGGVSRGPPAGPPHPGPRARATSPPRGTRRAQGD